MVLPSEVRSMLTCDDEFGVVCEILFTVSLWDGKLQLDSWKVTKRTMMLCAQVQSIPKGIPNELNDRILMLHTVFQFGARYVGVTCGLGFLSKSA